MRRFLLLCLLGDLMSSCAVPRIFAPVAPEPAPKPLIIKLDSLASSTVDLSGKFKAPVYILQGQGHHLTNNEKADLRDQTQKNADLSTTSRVQSGFRLPAGFWIVLAIVLLAILGMGIVRGKW